LPNSGGGFYNDGIPSFPDGGDSGGGSGSGGSGSGGGSSPSYTNQFWLEALPPGTNAFNSNSNAVTFILWSTTNTASYQLQTTLSLTDTNWTPQQIFIGASGQNWTPVTFSLSGQSTLFFRAINYSQDTTDSGLPDWWKIQNGLDPDDLSSSTNGVSDAYADPAGDGWTDLQKFEDGMNPNTFYTPPAPTVTVAPLSGDNGVLISWEPSLGNVTGYYVYRNGGYLASVSASQLSYQDNSVSVSAAASDAGSLPYYQVVAQYSSPSGTAYSSPSIQQTPASASLAVSTAILRGPMGQYYLAAPNIPNTITNLRVFAEPTFSEYPNILFDVYSQPMTNFNSTASAAYLDFPSAQFTNGLSVIPQSFIPYYNTRLLTCVPMGTNGAFGQAAAVSLGFFQYVSLSSDWYNSEIDSLETEQGGYWGNLVPFLDGTTQLQQNLVFQLESADEDYALEFAVVAIYPDSRPTVFPFNEFSDNYFLPAYAWANFHARYEQSEDSPSLVDELKPFEDNYFYRNFVVQSAGDLNPDGSMASDVHYAGGGYLPPPTEYNIGYSIEISNNMPFAFPDYAYAAGGSTNPASPLLSTNSQLIFSTWPGEGDIGVAQVNSTNLILSNGQANLFGLPYESVVQYYSDGTHLYSQTLTPGAVVPNVAAESNYPAYFYPQVQAPELQTVGYYFGEIDRDYLPGDYDFTPTTNISAPIIATPGTPLLLGAWAEESVDGSTNAPGFLEQYFDHSHSWNFINGQVTNQLGVLSEYGEFFPTDPGLAVLTTKTNSGGYGTLDVPVIGLYADRNHDGVIDTSFSGPDFCTPARPFQFWVNDDNDSGDTGGDDIPGEPASLGLIPNGVSGTVNGTRDLIDFFPVYVDIEGMLEASNLNYVTLTFRLSQADGALNFITTDLGTNNLLQYLTDTNEALALANASVTQITSTGVTLGLDFFNSVNFGNGGVILVEARTNTMAPLVLDILTNGYVLAEAQLPLNITGVEQMFRHKNLTAAVLGQIDGPPDRLTAADVTNALDDNGTNFIFLHGYNVNPNEARGTESEAFKRMYWSGSHARFYGVTWDGYQSQGNVPTAYGTLQTPLPVTPNYHTNVANAFLTAPYLAAFIDSLSGANVVAAHSLGNMVALSALNDYGANIQTYFMVDAAVAMEAIDTSTFPNNQMIYSTWVDYTNSLYASYWHNLFGSLDYRSKLGWPGRLSSFNNAQVYNFYSSGEEVLRSWEDDPPTNILTSIAQVFWNYYYSQSPLGSYVWVWQEKAKGTAATNAFLGSDHGGWKFNTNYSSLTVAQADALSAPQLQTNAFFDFGSPDFPNDYAVEGSFGNVYAYENNNRMLGDAIPALSYPVGANPVPRFQANDLNINMQGLENNWPSSRLQTTEGNNWHHSDYQVVAYTYTYQLFNEMVTLGNLK
jgi:pimeloyl-ACP methyl ester carboxylesterase